MTTKSAHINKLGTIFKRGLLLTLFTAYVAISGCGKVTQDTSKPKAVPSVDMAFRLPVSIATKQPVSAASGSASTASSSTIAQGQTQFSVHDSPIYVQVQGVSPDGKSDELSYGKGVLVITTMDAKDAQGKTTKKTTYESTSYNKTGISLTTSKLDESHFKFDSKNMEWVIKSSKIKKGLPLYFVQTYSDKNTYRFKLIDQAVVTGSKLISMGPITEYDTFIGVLYRYISSQTTITYDPIIQDLIQTLYDQQFFEYLSFNPPSNTVKKFNVKTPLFAFETNQLKTLTNLLTLVQTDKDEALAYLEKKDVQPYLPSKARSRLKQAISTLN